MSASDGRRAAVASGAATFAVVAGILLAAAGQPFTLRHDVSGLLERIRFIDGPLLEEPVRSLQYDRAKKAALIDLIKAGCRCGPEEFDRHASMSFRGDFLHVRAAFRRQIEVRMVLDLLKGDCRAASPERGDMDLFVAAPGGGEALSRLR